MSNATVELVGGPRDGDRVVVDLEHATVVVPVIALPEVYTELVESPSTVLRTAQYERVILRRSATGEVIRVWYRYVKGSTS